MVVNGCAHRLIVAKIVKLKIILGYGSIVAA